MTDKAKYYTDVNPNPDFSEIEAKILQNWAENNTFEKSVEQRDGAEEFVFYDGPPFANGLPHYGHLLTGYVKDVFPRYQTMLGKKVNRRFGWDCHGLPAEMGAEKELGISGRAAIQNYGIDKFNDRCRSDVMKFSGEWEKYVNRQARWVDFGNDYKTMDKSFMESVMWAFKQLFDKGLVYEAMRVMPYSWAAETPLSNFETRLDNSYRERADKAVTVAFQLEDGRKILAWTTTPWTLPSNLALAVKSDMWYDVVEDEKGDISICATSELHKYPHINHADIEKFKGKLIGGVQGSSLVGLTYKPLFPYFANQPNAFKIIAGDFIEEGSGTGVVHIAPGFGEDDYEVAKQNNIGVVVPVDSAGRFTDEVSDYVGRNVLETNDDIIKRLKEEGSLIKQEQYLHSYPHCWRTDEPLIYKAMPSWYVEVTKFKDRMVELNKSVNWMPEHVRDGLFGKWLEGARDWSISRNRFWGAPIPIWRSKSGKLHCVGSVVELEKLSGKTVKDLHRPYIDEIKFTIDGEEYTRVEDVLDCWFESGSMPFASQGLQGEKPAPADFIVEYTAQTRGWFYTMTVLGVALFDEIPFKNVICHGVVLGEPIKDPSTGKMVAQKLSKRLKNYPEPFEVYDKYGADALRWFMLSSPIMRGAELTIDKEGKFIRDVIRLYIKPIWNAYNFFVLYANADGIKAKFATSSENLMDAYILAKCGDSIAGIRSGMDAFDTPAAYIAVEQFFDVLNNWYIRRSKERFWSTEKTADKQAAYDTLYTVLVTMCQACAPLLPLITEEIFTNLTDGESVHLTDFPDEDEIIKLAYSNPNTPDELVAQMDKVRDVCNAALSVRSAANVRVRQPLAKLTVVGASLPNFAEIICDELNVKAVDFISEIAGFAEHKLKINFPILGKRLPDKIKTIIPAAKQNQWALVDGHLEIAGEKLLAEEYELLLEPKDKSNSAPLSSNDALVVLDLALTPELISEGLARDVVRMVQQARKDADLNVTDRIDLIIETSADIIAFKDYIGEQTLAASIILNSANDRHLCNFSVENTLEDLPIKIGFNVQN